MKICYDYDSVCTAECDENKKCLLKNFMSPVSTLIYMLLARHNPPLNPFLPLRCRVSRGSFFRATKTKNLSWEGEDINFNSDFIKNEVDLDISSRRLGDLRTLDGP